MRRIVFCMAVFCLSVASLSAEIKIISSEAWIPEITGSWNPEYGLSYSNTVYGDTYYNPGWQDMEDDETSLEFKTVTRYFNVGPVDRRNWSFSMPITNLNAEIGYQYMSQSEPDKKQDADQIYWGFIIGYKENGNSRETAIGLKRSNGEYYRDMFFIKRKLWENAIYIHYVVDRSGLKSTSSSYPSIYYPSCLPNKSPLLKIEVGTSRTYIKWGELELTDLPVYLEEITYITVLVGTQAKVQIGKPSVYGNSVYVNSQDKLIEQENYEAAKQKLYNPSQIYYEPQAVNLAICYVTTFEFDKGMELLEALINYNGITRWRN